MHTVVKVMIGGVELQNSEIEQLEVVQELGEHTRARIVFIRDASWENRLDTLLNQPITVELIPDLFEKQRIFEGSIVEGAQTHLLHVGAQFEITAISPSDRHEYVDTKYFPESTLSSLAPKLGVKLVKTQRSLPAFDYVQWGETEFQFLKRVVDYHGGFLVTTGAQVEIRSEFVDRGAVLRWGDTLLALTARARPTNHGVTGASYDPASKHTHVHEGVRQAPESLGGASQLVKTINQMATQAKGGGDPTNNRPGGNTFTPAAFKAMLKAESERMLGGAVVVEGESVVGTLMAGDLVELVSGTSFILPTTGKLGLVKVVHTFDEQLYRNRFVATPWKGFTSFETPESPHIPGPVTAEVTDNQDPDKMGRIKIAYRWQTGSNMTNWARLATLHAGNGRGVMFLPEVGDEVVVAFEHGDVERPIIVGSLWNGKDKAPEVADKNSAKRIITRSGATIQLLDDDGKETIELFTPEAKCIVQLTNGGGSPVITIKSAGDISFEADKEIRFKAQKLTQDISSDSVRKVGGDDSADVSGAATIKTGGDLVLTAGMNAMLKGGINLDSVAGALNNIVGSLVNIQPPGYVPKPAMAKPVSVQKTDFGDRKKPEKAEGQRTADPETPRSN